MHRNEGDGVADGGSGVGAGGGKGDGEHADAIDGAIEVVVVRLGVGGGEDAMDSGAVFGGEARDALDANHDVFDRSEVIGGHACSSMRGG